MQRSRSEPLTSRDAQPKIGPSKGVAGASIRAPGAAALVGTRRYASVMGTIREYGYREYPDDLTPGNGGESSLLFNADGDLSGHAPFYAAGGSTEEPNQTNDAPSWLPAVGAINGMVVTYVLPRVVRAIQAKRARRTTALGVLEAKPDSDHVADTVEVEPDPQEELIREVEALCEESERKKQEVNGHSLADNDDDPEADTATNARPLRRRRVAGH